MPDVHLPQSVREKLGLGKRGALPKSIRYRSAVKDCEQLIMSRLPQAVRVVLDIASDPATEPRLRMDAARYILDRGLGRPAPSAIAPAEDASTPPEARTSGHVASQLGALLRHLPESEVRRLQGVYLDALTRHGIVTDDSADSASSEDSADSASSEDSADSAEGGGEGSVQKME